MRVASFADGLWIVDNVPGGPEFGVPENAVLVAQNIHYLPSGGVRGRRGCTLLGTASAAVRSLWRHYPRTGTPSTLVAVDNGANVSFENASGTSGTFAAVPGGSGFTTGFPWYFTNWPSQNKSFLANGQDAMQSYDGTTIAPVVSAGGAGNLDPVPNGPYLTVHKARLWATQQSEINFSVYASAVNDPTTFPGANQLSLNDQRGGVITGLESFFDFLIGFKSTSLWRFIGDISTLTGAQLAKYSDVGCTAPNTVAVTPYGIIFLAKDGLRITDGVNPNPDELSAPVRPLFVNRSSENQYPNAVGQWYPRENMYVLKLDPDAPSAYIVQRLTVLSDNPFIGERSRAVWLWATDTNWPAASGTTIVPWPSDQDDNRIITGDASGNVWTKDADNTATDNGDPIISIVQTASRPLDAKGLTGRVYQVKPLYRGTQALAGAIRYDQHSSDDSTFMVGDTITFGGPLEVWPQASVWDFGHLGRFVSLVLTNPSDSYQFELHMIDVDVKLRSPRVWRSTN